MSFIQHTLQIKELQVGYGEPLLKSISLNIQSPCLAGIIANNGKGKTTLLKSIAGLLNPLSGKIFLDQKSVWGSDHAERSRIISLGLASNYLTFPISVFELVSLGRYPYNNRWAGLSQNDENVISLAMDTMGITALKNKFVTDLSDGERQKAFNAKIIAQDTPVMLFDEPTAFLDYASKKQFFRSMKDLAESQQKIIMIASHDVDFLTAYAHEMLMIGENESFSFGKTEEITQTEYFITHFTKK